MRKSGIGLAVGLVTALMPVAPLHAQIVNGVVESEAGEPVSQGLVLAMDSLGSVRVTGITSVEGTFQLQLPFPGAWTIRVERFGYGTGEETILFSGTDPRSLNITVAPDPVALGGIDVDVDRRCRERPRQEEVPRLWAEARRLLARDPSGGTARFKLERVERFFAAWEQIITEEAYQEARSERRSPTWDTLQVEGLSPFPVPDPVTLVRDGFVVPLSPDAPVRLGEELYAYYAPWPHVILSDAFLSTHCFFVRDEREGHIGLAFEPHPGADLEYDVLGTLWLPQVTEVFPQIDFRYTRYPREGQLFEYLVRGPAGVGQGYAEASLSGRVGGRMDMSFVSGVGWIVHRFLIRSPKVGRQQDPLYAPGIRDRIRRGEDIQRMGRLRVERWSFWRLAGITEVEFTLLAIQLPEGGK